MAMAYSARFQGEDQAAAYLKMCNDYMDYGRNLQRSVEANLVAAEGRLATQHRTRRDPAVCPGKPSPLAGTLHIPRPCPASPPG